MTTLHSAVLRTVDVARRSGYSVQQIRDLERDGVLPPAARSAAGHRGYAEVHLRCALAYRPLAVAAGPTEARRMLRALHTVPFPDVLTLLDAAHAGLDRERADLAHAVRAAAAISAEPVDDACPADAMTVSELAAALGVRPSALRHWDAEGLVVSDRLTPRGARRYTPAQVRDARIVHQLRAAGFRVAALRSLMPQLRHGRRTGDVEAALAARAAGIAARSQALFEATVAMGAIRAVRAE